MVILKYDAYVRLVVLLVVMLTPLIYASRSMPMALTASLENALRRVTQISWVTLFLRVHER